MQGRPVTRLVPCGVVEMEIAHRLVGSGVDAIPFLDGRLESTSHTW